jgi:DNA-binding response OmpR family regulator
MTDEPRKLVLVVDDEPDVREYLRSALEDANFEVQTAPDGMEAWDLIRRRPPDLISLDLVMPRHSGAKLYRELQRNKSYSKIPVLIVTGHARDELGRTDLEEMTMSGPEIYLEKPVRPASYVAAVRKLLGIMAPEAQEPDPVDLRQSLDRALSGADSDSLMRALNALRRQ